MIIDDELYDDLWTGEKSICFFVHKRKFYWVLDYRYNMDLNAEKDYTAILASGDITQNQFDMACKEFRGGGLNSDETNFLKYLETETAQQCSAQDLRALLHKDDYSKNSNLLDRMEKFYLDGNDLTAEDFKASNELASRQSSFYINFDRKYTCIWTGKGSMKTLHILTGLLKQQILTT